MIGDPVPESPVPSSSSSSSTVQRIKTVPGREGGDPAGIIRADAPGLLIVGYQSLPRPIELAPDKFDQYLGEEGLDEIEALRAGRGAQIGYRA